MSKTGNNPEKSPSKKEELKKIPKHPQKVSRTSKKKCLACKDGLVFDGRNYHSCRACEGQGFIV